MHHLIVKVPAASYEAHLVIYHSHLPLSTVFCRFLKGFLKKINYDISPDKAGAAEAAPREISLNYD